ncbi:unnamed protein product [Urochloa humidicola]
MRSKMVGVGTVVSAAIGWLVESILGNFFTGKLEAWVRGVGLADDVEELEAAVRSVQMVAAAAKGRKIENEPLARSLSDLKGLLDDAEDVMDDLDYCRLELQVNRDNARAVTTDAVNNTASSFTWPSNLICNIGRFVSTVSSRCKRKREDEHNIAANSHIEILGNKTEFSCAIKNIAKKLRGLNHDVSKALGIDVPNSTGASNLGTYHDIRTTTSYLVEPKVYGRDAEIESINKLIVSNKSNGLTVLPIVGVGGVGKTTLAQLVYKGPRVESQFQIKIWICVSDRFDVTRVTKEMLDYVSGQKQAETGNLNKLQEHLERQMKYRRFLIVLDDVWDDMNQHSWNKLLAPLKFNQAIGNMIIVTTRKLSIADMTKTIEPVNLDALKGADFWLLFKSCAFGDEEYEEDGRLCIIGKQIAKDLRGNPLAAKTVGALLKRNINVGNWSNILNNQEWKSLQVKGGIMPVLKLSYDNLPEHLQQCFRYCCLFPKDYHFDEAKLIRIWISQGFVHGSQTGKKQKDAGKLYLSDLLNSGFFQHVSNSSHTFVVMHDLLHDLACQVSRADLVTINGSKFAEILPTTRHLSVIIYSAYHGNSENFVRNLRQITTVKKLRSLVLIGTYDSCFFNCFKDIFKEAHNLRFLHIEADYSDFDCFISNLGSCTHVRYIESIFHGLGDKVLPHALTKFYHLQVLDVGLYTNMTLPHGMSNLVSMQHLVAAEDVHSVIPNIGKMTALQELPKFMVHVQNDSGFELRQLQSMNQLVQLGIYRLDNIRSKQEASEARLTDKIYLEDVRLSWDDDSCTSSGASTETATNVLEGLTPHQSLKHLQIIGYRGSSYPSWLATDVSVISLKSLHLEKCKELGVLPHLQKLLSLTKLELINLPNIVEVEIPCLEELVLIELPRLEKCVATSNSELNSHLRALVIEKCPELKDFALFTSENFCSFDVIRSSGVSEMESRTAEHFSAEAEKKKWLPVLRVLTIHGCPRLMSSHPLPPAANTQLSIKGFSIYPAIERHQGHLLVKSSNELNVLDAKILAFQNLTDVTTVQIGQCPNLTVLSFEGFRQLNNVRNITIFKCGNMHSPCIVPDAASEAWRAKTCLAFPRLKHLRIESCGGVAGKWLTDMLQHTQSLEELEILFCPKIKSISIQEADSDNLEIQQEFHLHIPLNVLSTLRKFHIQSCSEMQLCCSKGFGGFTSLTDLETTGCPILLSSVGEVFSLASSLLHIRIHDLPKKLQPYFPGNLTFLKELTVWESPALQSLRLHYCTALERLTIHKCEQLVVLEDLQYLSSLRYLTIEMNPELSAAWVRKCQEVEERTRSGHVCLLPPALEELSVSGLQDELVPYLLADLRCLSILQVWGSPNLTSLQLGSLAALRTLYIQGCASLVSLQLQGCPSEIQGYSNQDLTSLQPSSLGALKSLVLQDCARLASLERQFLWNLTNLHICCCPGIPALLELLSQQQAEGFIIFPQLEKLYVDDLSALTTSVCKHLTSLRYLRLSDLKGATRFTDEQEKALQLLMMSLQELEFAMCEGLTDLPDVLYSLHSLRRLEIFVCPCISRIPVKGLPPSLEELEIDQGSAQLEGQCRMLPTEKLKVQIRVQNFVAGCVLPLYE